jgi:hypothetical protein
MLFNAFENLTVIGKAAPTFTNGTGGHKYCTRYATCGLIFCIFTCGLKILRCAQMTA